MCILAFSFQVSVRVGSRKSSRVDRNTCENTVGRRPVQSLIRREPGTFKVKLEKKRKKKSRFYNRDSAFQRKIIHVSSIFSGEHGAFPSRAAFKRLVAFAYRDLWTPGSLDRDELFTQEYRRWETRTFLQAALSSSYAETRASTLTRLARAFARVILSE